MKKEIHIFTGHFGSGKTEVSLNFALREKNMGKKVSIVDLDIVNPYFRTNDAKRMLNENGIRVIANDYASSNVDMPTMPLDILSVFSDDSDVVIFDVGGDDDGAYALGQYKHYFDKYGGEVHFVVNTKRPLSRNADELLELAKRIEYASRMRITDIYNNTNLSKFTDGDTLFSDYAEIEKISDRLGIPVAKNCGTKLALEFAPPEAVNTLLPMEIHILKPWEIAVAK